MKLPRIRWRWALAALLMSVTGGVTWAGFWWQRRYDVADEMLLPVREYTAAEYPENPGERSVHMCQYSGRTLRLIRRDATHFDFIFEPRSAHTAKVAFLNIDVSLMTPGEPSWTKSDKDLERIALTDRQWNRQQVRFDRRSPHLAISGGDGFETEHLFTAELAKNCLNAGLWEVLLTVNEDGRKATYYHGWFTFPLGHYRDLFEHNSGLSYWDHWYKMEHWSDTGVPAGADQCSYWDHWYKMEHWSDPAGTPVSLEKLRTIREERDAPATFNLDEPLIVAGEQVLKRRTVDAKNILTWGDFFDGRPIQFAAFIPPGRYSVRHPRKNEFQRLSQFDKAIVRQIESPAGTRPLDELELDFHDKSTGEPCRFLVSGFALADLPRLPTSRYQEGLYMPMGIGVPPFFQNYDELRRHPPGESPYFSVLVDGASRWLNHHDVAVDGPVLHRDLDDPNLLHAYLLSYERHTLIAHIEVSLAR